MVSHMLVVMLLAAPQPGDVAMARRAYSSCLGSLLRTDLKSNVEIPAFEAKLSSACKTEEESFRTTAVRLDMAVGTSRTTAEQSATNDITDILQNTKDHYRDYKETNTEPR